MNEETLQSSKGNIEEIQYHEYTISEENREEMHRRSQDFGLGGGPPGRRHAALHQSFEAVAGSWGSVSAPAVSRVRAK